MSHNDPLSLFAGQLATWAEQIIENGRTPFRRVDLFHPLLTEEGPCRPPLTLWINRQSMIAGGLIFLPATDQTDFSLEAAAASALGLQHFVTWGSDQISILSTAPLQQGPVKSLPLTGADNPSVFHHRLYELIDELKLLSVTGRVPPGKESDYYLLNLINETEAIAQDGFIGACRLRRGETAQTLSAEQEARDWNRLSLIRLLCLLNWSHLPNDVSAETLHRSLEEGLTSLPAPLASSLSQLAPKPEQPIPTESAIAYHHLLLRLRQVGWVQESSRGPETLDLLIRHWHGNPSETRRGDDNRLMFHSLELAPKCRYEVSHSASQLAANSLWRLLCAEAQPTQQQGDAFRFNAPFDAHSLHANFYSNQRPDITLRRELTGHLRASWPNRHLSIPGELPLWITEATHLLGLTRADTLIELHLPGNWLKLLRGTSFAELIFDNFSLERIDASNPQRHLLTLRRDVTEMPTQCILPGSRQRTLELGTDSPSACDRLLYTLELPDALYGLFDEQQLVPLAAESEEAEDPAALLLFSRSQLARQLWHLATGQALPVEKEALVSTGATSAWLVPEARYLQELQPATADNVPDINIQLARLLGLPDDLDLETSVSGKATSNQARPISRTLTEELLHQLEVEGIPHFPDTYLYRQETGPLREFHFTPPLTLQQEMLGEYELIDAEGVGIRISGEETMEALRLAALLEKKRLELPEDRQQTAEMLDNYRQDLQKLLEKIDTLCLQHTEQPQAAVRLRKKLWLQLPLPPFKWLSG